MKQRVKVVLCGKEYALQTEDAPSYVYQLAKNLEKRISDITENNPRQQFPACRHNAKR